MRRIIKLTTMAAVITEEGMTEAGVADTINMNMCFLPDHCPSPITLDITTQSPLWLIPILIRS